MDNFGFSLTNKEPHKYWFCSDDGIEVSFKEDMLFPLQKIYFEGNEYYVPRCYNNILNSYYGNWEAFPKTGILHHDLGRGPLQTWAKKNNIDMVQVLDDLKELC